MPSPARCPQGDTRLVDPAVFEMQRIMKEEGVRAAARLPLLPACVPALAGESPHTRRATLSFCRAITREGGWRWGGVQGGRAPARQGRALLAVYDRGAPCWPSCAQVDFDEARMIHARRKMVEFGIDPDTGMPLDECFCPPRNSLAAPRHRAVHTRFVFAFDVGGSRPPRPRPLPSLCPRPCPPARAQKGCD